MARTPAADNGYLVHRRNRGWYVQILIPADLRPLLPTTANGKEPRKVVKALGTHNKAEARRLRGPIVHELQARFARLRQHRPASKDEVEAIQWREFRRFYDHLRRNWIEVRTSGAYTLGDLAADLAAAVGEDDTGSPTADYWPEAREQAEKALAELGAVITAETIEAMALAILRARHAAVTHALEGVEPPARDGAAPPVRRGSGHHAASPLLAECARQYLADLAKRTTKQTVGQATATLRLFGDFAGPGRTMQEIDKATAAGFLDAIARLNPNYGRHPGAKSMALVDLLTRFPGTLSPVTKARHMRTLAGMWGWCEARGMASGQNPFAKLVPSPARRKDRSGYLPFDDRELVAAFARLPGDWRNPARVRRPSDHLGWLMALSAFAGLRLDEAAGLRCEDVRVSDGTVYLDVREYEGAEGAPRRHLKTAAAVRQVPVHSELIRAGLLAYVARLRVGPLFPGCKPGGPDGKRSWYVSKAFTFYRRKCGIADDRKVFHSLRKSFATALDRAGAHPTHAPVLLGHERDFSREVYVPGGPGFAALKAAVELVRYAGLDISPPRRSE
jgi:integrase